MTLPLTGFRILSLAEQLPGPLATMLLADLGADVILVERPAGGDPSRRFEGRSESLGRNKRSVTLDLKSEAGRLVFLRLVDTANVVVEGFRPGSCTAWSWGQPLCANNGQNLSTCPYRRLAKPVQWRE